MGSFRFHRADIFFAFKARSMPVSFRGQQRADDEGEKARLSTDKIRCEAGRFYRWRTLWGRLALTSPLSSADLCPKIREPTSASESQTKSGSGETRRGKILGIGYFRCRGIKSAAARCHGRMKKEMKKKVEGYGCTFTPSASSSSTMTPVSSV